ncbi:C1QL [Mytilus coruscus]|uniref:C1QL n=1 Tax=Mytilus coruscus TaxID=42192 RepID=A0A6J8EHS5_MYTCO|nr:C1QL [Mytilus coruscus]
MKCPFDGTSSDSSPTEATWFSMFLLNCSIDEAVSPTPRISKFRTKYSGEHRHRICDQNLNLQCTGKIIRGFAILGYVMKKELQTRPLGELRNHSSKNHQDETFSAFAASLTAAKTLGTGGIVKFDKLWTNVNNDYDPSTGIYTAPKPRLFQFSCTVMTPSGNTLHVFLGKKDSKTVAVYPGQTGHNMGTLNVVLELK